MVFISVVLEEEMFPRSSSVFSCTYSIFPARLSTPSAYPTVFDNSPFNSDSLLLPIIRGLPTFNPSSPASGRIPVVVYFKYFCKV